MRLVGNGGWSSRQRGLADRGERLGVRLARLLGREELVVLLRGDRPQLEVHHRVVRAAELRAAAHVGALGVDRDLEHVAHVAGEHVPLEQHLRHPERVDDVAAECSSKRICLLVGSTSTGMYVVGAERRVDRLAVRAGAVAVGELPVPLEGDDLDDVTSGFALILSTSVCMIAV